MVLVVIMAGAGCELPRRTAKLSRLRTIENQSSTAEHPAPMTLRDLFREALEQGGDAVSRALGHAEAELSRNPGSLQALVYKGSLLTMIGESVLGPAKRSAYIRAGITFMDNALAGAWNYPAIAWELTYVRGTSLACLPRSPDRAGAALEALRLLVEMQEFPRQTPFDRTRCLTLLAGLAEEAGYAAEAKLRFTEARALDEDLAIRLYDDWRTKSSTAPETS